MKGNYLLLISLLVVGALFVPAVSAEIIINEEMQEFAATAVREALRTVDSYQGFETGYANTFDIAHIENYTYLNYIDVIVTKRGYEKWISALPDGLTVMTYTLEGRTEEMRVYTTSYKDVFGTITGYKYTLFPQNWDVQGLYGAKRFTLSEPLITTQARFKSTVLPTYSNIRMLNSYVNAEILITGSKQWANNLIVSEVDGLYTIKLVRNNERPNPSKISLYNADDIVYFANNANNDIELFEPKERCKKIVIESGTKTYTYDLGNVGRDLQDGRTGTVTMTDHNGTTITGFDVRAVNHYTGEEYTISTDTDVATITLPMDRTIEIRNPQTGVYEEAPIGYYRFFGYKDGYKMLNEDGIKVSVMPEKYGSYQLCIIGVTSESGYLTGKHQFQIRSRSDNSILQTGTVSAKSATTGEWFNTTVSGGLASLILPYDTSNTISQYAGNYYVYATSPGYQENDYGTQIVVMPHTVSEIRDVFLTPIGGIPTPGNITLRIQVFSETGPGVANANIFIAGVLGEGSSIWDTYTASSTGYLTVSVPANSTYDIVASGTGYYDSARRVEVFAEDPALIEIKLYISGAPTVEPTTQPTGWVTPTVTPTVRPTDVAPGNNPIDNFRIILLNMGFDDYYTDWLTGLYIICIGAAIGYCLVKRVGAMCGAPIGLLTAVGLGLIPIWALVLIIVIVALAYAKFFMGR